MNRYIASRHVEVYRRQGEFAGWPANYGLWTWGNETVCIFAAGRLGSPDGGLHLEDSGSPFTPMQARSSDGGLTWTTEAFNARVPGSGTLSADEHVDEALKARNRMAPSRDIHPLEAPIDFLDAETIILAARTGITGRPASWFYVSRDRARSWEGPFGFEGLDLAGGISARTDIVALGRHDALFMLTTTKDDGEEGRVFCARTRDGARTFRFRSYLWNGRQGYAIMPASARLSDGTILTLVRRNDEGKRGWIDAYASIDEGRTWSFAGRPVADTGHMGNPPALTRLDDDRLVLTYGYRSPPFGIRAVVSTDGGASWSEPMTIRDDGGGPDLGYPRTVMRPDGSVLAVYYFNCAENGERFIAATAFKVP
ncbi:sialidase family protein [Shinella sp. BYT-45]|uniref:sialidase family protein n=1 Tax=Shinella sp. BYT-45 TaxID=3377377 RepID=UPI00398181C2